MLKNIIIIIGLFYCTLCISQNKAGIIEYSIADVNVTFKEGNAQNDLIRSFIIAAKNQKYELKFNNAVSSFSSIESLTREGIDEHAIKMAKIAFITSDAFYLDLNKKELITKKQDNILLKSEALSSGWTILTETKLIDKYLCYKAEYKKPRINRFGKEIILTITAWFAPSLPYSFGPIDFHGLPGLILELQQSYTTYLATKIMLQDKELEIEFPQGKTITSQEYDKKLSSGN